MKIAFANDHAAASVRGELIRLIREGGHEVLDCGTASEESVDYPDMAEEAAALLASGKADRAILVCGTGIGMSIAANKFAGVRCALCTDDYAARMARAHNDANVLALRGRRMDIEQNSAIIDTFLNTEFEGERHQRRLDKIAGIEARQCARPADQTLKEERT